MAMLDRFVLSSALKAAMILLFAYSAWAQAPASKTTPRPVAAPLNKVAIQVSDNDPKAMNLALNNAKNIVDYYKGKGQKVVVEVVTYGPGLHMLRDDTSPVKQRVAEMSLAMPELSFAACANTQTNMAKQEGKAVPFVSEARVVPSGVVRLMELQRKGYAYIRP
jgi:intracellular sulfur oxidation DsrE/DsrF family protein